MAKTIRIGTRESALALWQANRVKDLLEALSYQVSLVPIKSTGDIVLNKPLYELGVTGIFTRNLDIAMLNEEIDIAVHSMKDVPTILPKGIVQAAVLERAEHRDLLVYNESSDFLNKKEGTIATGSLRRKAQWSSKYPEHDIVGLRGNVNTRLQKLVDSDWNGAIFAAAGLQRIDVMPENSVFMDWMIPAPAQGAIMITAMHDDLYSLEACQKLNDRQTDICTGIEREFLKVLEGGCTSPIGAYAHIVGGNVEFKGVLLSVDGKKKVEIERSVALDQIEGFGRQCAEKVLADGGQALINQIRIDKNVSIYATMELKEDQKKLFHAKIETKDSNFISVEHIILDKVATKWELENVIITSKNAIKALLKVYDKSELSFKNIYCVGLRTRKMAEEVFGRVKHMEKNAKTLANHLVKNFKEKEITFLCGNLRRDELPQILGDSGIKVNEMLTYNVSFSPVKLDKNADGIMFFSPSTVTSYLLENNVDKVAFCIGETTANEAKKHFKTVHVAKTPTVESVIELVNHYYV
ncbi:MAG: hydroxymethylbilane synthase [Patiriisocius sp.]|jgi:hydroxymethylbilane synthase